MVPGTGEKLQAKKPTLWSSAMCQGHARCWKSVLPFSPQTALRDGEEICHTADKSYAFQQNHRLRPLPAGQRLPFLEGELEPSHAGLLVGYHDAKVPSPCGMPQDGCSPSPQWREAPTRFPERVLGCTRERESLSSDAPQVQGGRGSSSAWAPCAPPPAHCSHLHTLHLGSSST